MENFRVSRGPPTVPLTRILRNVVFLKSQNPRNAGTLCKNIFKCDFRRVLSHSVNTRTSLPQTQLFKTENWHRFPSTAMFLFSLSLVLVIIVIISTLFVLQLGVPLGHSKVDFFWFLAVFCSGLELVQLLLWEVANFLKIAASNCQMFVKSLFNVTFDQPGGR